jgi:hypothetical protein
VSEAERIAWAVADQLDGLDAAAMGRHPAFQRAVEDALRVVDERGIVEAIVAQGPLAGARNPHAVVVARLRQLPALAAERARVVDVRAEDARWQAVDRAVKRAQTLRGLVDAGTIYADEAARWLAEEFSDASLREIAEAALAGGRS